MKTLKVINSCITKQTAFRNINEIKNVFNSVEKELPTKDIKADEKSFNLIATWVFMISSALSALSCQFIDKDLQCRGCALLNKIRKLKLITLDKYSQPISDDLKELIKGINGDIYYIPDTKVNRVFIHFTKLKEKNFIHNNYWLCLFEDKSGWTIHLMPLLYWPIKRGDTFETVLSKLIDEGFTL